MKARLGVQVVDGLEYKVERLYCPRCRMRHRDLHEWALIPHHKHLCNFCGTLWDMGEKSFGS